MQSCKTFNVALESKSSTDLIAFIVFCIRIFYQQSHIKPQKIAYRTIITERSNKRVRIAERAIFFNTSKIYIFITLFNNILKIDYIYIQNIFFILFIINLEYI
ncbi:hypothetical protein HRAG_02512 [Helicobacter bilis ATCC 43879]|uniref:Uncharacterized protein n=1 Tax=Helicobacter bilis ATCC 43879 TaxID=613026 RepID=T5LPZ4_9HELI|nr:hypothetical protein HRAG_02512 [Helicobacter bilis ATCC 43879]